MQDVLLRAYRASDRFDGAHPRAWLLTILRNTHINRGRRWRPSLLFDPDSHDEARAGLPGATVVVAASWSTSPRWPCGRACSPAASRRR